MGRTLPTITQIFAQEEQAIDRFKHALRRSDQRALEDLLVARLSFFAFNDVGGT